MDFIDLFDSARKENGRRFSALRKPPCMPPHKHLKNTLLNSRRTDDSLPISTIVTPDINHDSDDSENTSARKSFPLICLLVIVIQYS